MFSTNANISGSKYHPCCGKTICCGKIICSGCYHGNIKLHIDNKNKQLCAFCRTPAPKTNKDIVECEKKRVEAGDAIAMCEYGLYYALGENGFTQDITKALELWHRSGDLGCAESFHRIGYTYSRGERGVEVDKKKAMHYYELAAMRGDTKSRRYLAHIEARAGNLERAKKHWIIAVRDGHSDALATIKSLHSRGLATKEEYTKVLRAYQEYLGEIKSDQRDEAAAFDDDYKYY